MFPENRSVSSNDEEEYTRTHTESIVTSQAHSLSLVLNSSLKCECKYNLWVNKSCKMKLVVKLFFRKFAFHYAPPVHLLQIWVNLFTTLVLQVMCWTPVAEMRAKIGTVKQQRMADNHRGLIYHFHCTSIIIQNTENILN